MKRTIYRLIELMMCLMVFVSCDKSDEPQSQTKTQRTVLIYMAANNSLGTLGYDEADLREMRQAVLAGALGKNNRLLIFHADTRNNRSLLEMLPDGSTEILKNYGSTGYVVEADFMLGVFNDTKSIAPAEDYGLVMWSHSFGWTQNGIDDDGPSLTPKTWGEDKGRAMNISTLARVLKASPWSWIYFDCCFMGSVEVAYELAPVLPKMVASATEIPLDGMPYDKNLALFFQKTPDLVKAAQNTFEYYDRLTMSDRTASVCVLDLAGMTDLAEATRRIYFDSEIVKPNAFYNLPLEIAGGVVRFFDFGIYVKGLCDANRLPDDFYAGWHKAWSKVVLYHKATPYLWDEIDLAGFTGLSTFIPENETQQGYRGYNILRWFDSVAKYLYDKTQVN